MHIAEGVLSAPVLVAGAALAAAGIGWGLKKLPAERLMTASLAGAAFFVASLIHVPVGVTSAHLILNGLVGILVGWAAVPVIFAALLLQSLLFQFGGITVLGVNTATMAAGALAAAAIFRNLCPADKTGWRALTVTFLAAAAAVLVSALLTACALAFSAEGFRAAAAALLVAHLPVMAAEGVVTALVVAMLARRLPKVLEFGSDR